MRRESGRWWCGSAVVLGVALALTGCSDDSGGDAAAPPSPSASASASEPSPSATPTVASPTLPPEAQQPDVAGAEAFVRYYFDTLNYAYRTGDLAPVLPLRDEECVACKRSEETVEDGFADGGHIEGGEITVSDVTVTPGDPEQGLEALVVLQQQAASLLTKTGSVAETIDPVADLLIGAILKYEGDGWSVVAWGKPDVPQ